MQDVVTRKTNTKKGVELGTAYYVFDDGRSIEMKVYSLLDAEEHRLADTAMGIIYHTTEWNGGPKYRLKEPVSSDFVPVTEDQFIRMVQAITHREKVISR